jgi:large subunit ribosomal protein L10
MAKSSISRQIGKKNVSVKTKVLGETGDLITRSQAVVLTEYRGLTVPQMSDIRKKLRDADADFSVVKNTLFKRAAGDSASDAQLEATLNGPTAAVFALGDPVAAAKIVSDYIAANRNTPLKVKGGLISGKFYTPAQVEALSKVPATRGAYLADAGRVQLAYRGLRRYFERYYRQLCLYASGGRGQKAGRGRVIASGNSPTSATAWVTDSNNKFEG